VSETADPSQRGRIDAVDLARFVALVAMAVYHFTWDLEHFGYVAQGLPATGGWRLFARIIASSFLFLAGVSLVLAHGRAVRWRPFWKRWLQVAAGAAAVTAATYVVFGANEFVYFGILHQIAFASLAGLAFLRLPFWATALAAAVVIALPQVLSSPAFDTRLLAWIGFSQKPPLSFDFVPIFPWFGAVLAGIAAGHLGLRLGAFDRFRRLNPALGRLSPALRLGRHTLLFYLLHQPVLFGAVWLATQVAPPDVAARFDDSCRRQCVAVQDAATCDNYCGCAKRELDARGILESVVLGSGGEDTRETLQDVVNQCSFEALNPQ
jgi:uncharacterized membrane protein